MQKKRGRLVYSAIKTPDGTVLESKHVHHMVTHTDRYSKEDYMLDGGLDYQRVSINHFPALDISVYDTDDHKIIREYVNWVYQAYSRNGDEPPRHVNLKDMSDAHVKAVIKTQKHAYPQIIDVMREELYFRRRNGITVED